MAIFKYAQTQIEGCSRSRILGNVTAKSGNFEKSVVSHFKRILTANFEKRKPHDGARFLTCAFSFLLSNKHTL